MTEILDRKVNTSHELHELMENYNWDFGYEIPLWAIRNPICDKGTVLMIYWKADPGYFCKYKDRNEVRTSELPLFDLINEIEQKYSSGFYKSNNIPFNPRNDNNPKLKGYNWVDEYSDLPKKRLIPALMLLPNKDD